MKKSKPFVTIPQNSVCVPLSDVLFTHSQLTTLRASNCDMEQQIRKKDYRIAELEAQVTELSKKLSDTEEELSRENDGKLLWYRKYMDLYDKVEREKEDSNAQA